MYIRKKYKFRAGDQRLYAVGQRAGVISSIRAIFLNHGMKIHKEEGTTLTYFPGGWLDRIESAYSKSVTILGPDVDHFSITYQHTNNPLVTLLEIKTYHKTNFLFDKITRSRIAKFYSALEQESAIASVVMVDVEEWKEFLQHYPELDCSPYWPTEAEINAGLAAKGIDPHFYKNKPLI